MRAHTEGFKNQIKELGREIDSRITYGNNTITAEQLFSVSPITNANILKSVMKQLDFESSVEVPKNTVVKYEFGLKVNGEYEYLDYGKFIVYSCEYNEDTKTYNHVCYDGMLKTMKDYKSLQNGTFPMTVREYINNLCLDCDLIFGNSTEEFANYDQIINEDLYSNLDYTYRDIMDELAQVTASSICINNDDMVEVRYITDTSDEIDEEYFKDKNVKFGEKYGPINSIVLSRSAESDNIYLQDETSVSENGLCEVKIIDNQIMNFNNRNDYLPAILEKLNGLEYYINDFTSTGVLYYELCDKYISRIGENTYTCVLFNDEPKISQGLIENIYTEKPQDSVTDYSKSDKTDRKINQLYIIADKQNQTITQVVSKTTDLSNEIVKIETTINGTVNTISSSGGSNLLRNPIGNFNNDYWEGNGAESYTDTHIQNKTGQRCCWLLNSGNHKQSLQTKNGNFTFSFMFEKLIELSNIQLKINDVLYEIKDETSITFNVTDNNITIEFIGDVNKCAYLMNLMLNEGTIAQVYSNNANETITDTVKIGKGIKISATGANAELDAQADGIRIKNTITNETKTEFTDKGTKTDELEANKATISKLLIADVGNQTWINRL
ncbi:MAG: hypothetical protein V8Q75_06525 [Bacilli bacterium]